MTAGLPISPATLRALRKARLLTQAALAERAGLSRHTVERLERRHAQSAATVTASLATVAKLANALAVDHDALIETEGAQDVRR